MKNDFVEERKVEAKVTSDSFHLWLTLSRLMALSFGQETLTVDQWKVLLNMEKLRLGRL